MNAGGPGQGSQGGAGSESGGQNNNQATTTTSSQQQQKTTTTSNPFTQTTTTTSPTSTSTSTSSSSSGSRKTAIVGGVIGGIAGLLLIALLVIFLLNRRQKKRIAEKRGSAEPVTYSTINSAFAGVPFGHSPRTSQHDSLLPPQPVLTPSTAPYSPHGVGIRGGEVHDVERDSGDYFLPTYAESQAGSPVGDAHSLGRLNTSSQGPSSEATISPMSVRHPGGTPVTPTSGISPQTTGGEIPLMMPAMPQHTRDTMGFPVDSPDLGLNRTSTPGFPIVAPTPRHPLVHQDSLERAVREGMMNRTPELQDTSLLGPRNGVPGRVLSQELMRESPVLGNMNPVRMQGEAAPSNLGGGGAVQRFASQRTVSSVSSMGISIVSDTELERLGVGSRGRHLT